jgi:O-succinylbenzoic acid--CoA ligase
LNILIRSIELGTQPVAVESSADFSAIVPTQLHRALNSDSQLLAHLKKCQSVLVGGGPLDAELRQRAIDAGIKVTTTYGMTETSGGVVYDGNSLEGISIEIQDGRIALQGPQVALGYLDSTLPTNNGWFITNDLGEIKDGMLIVHGRADDQIISGGEKISLSAIETYLQSEFKNPDIIAFAHRDREWGEKLCIATTTDIALESLQVKLKERFGAHASPKELFKVASIPYLAIGKPDRKKLADDHA